MESDEERKQARRDSYKAAAASFAGGLAELAAVNIGSSWALMADTAHNLGDALGYGINGLTAHQTHEKSLKWRKRAASLVCLGALAVGVKSTQEIVVNDSERPESFEPAVALGAGAVSLAVHRRAKKHKHLGGGHGDNAKHARWDLYCAPITIATSGLASLGVEKIDSFGGVAVSMLTIWINRPTDIK